MSTKQDKKFVTIEKKVLVPSQIGIGNTDIGMLGSGLKKSTMRTDLPYEVIVNDSKYLVGTNVEAFTTPLQRMDFLRLGDSAEGRSLTYTALGLAVGPGKHPSARVMVGFPVEVMKDQTRAKEILSALKSWLVGSHKFVINGVTYELDIEKVSVMAQPLGAYFAWATTNEGKYKVSVEEANGKILVVDIGFNTLDLYGLQNGAIWPRYTGGDTAGVRRAAEILRDHIRREYKVTNISRLQANDYLLGTTPPTLETAGRSIDLAPIIEQALEASTTQISDFCESIAGNGNEFHKILFSGGGSELLRKRMLRHYPSALVLPDAVMANSVGMAHAARVRWADAPLVIGLDPGFGGFKCTALVAEEVEEE